MRTFQRAQSSVLGPGPLASVDTGPPARTGGLGPLTVHRASRKGRSLLQSQAGMLICGEACTPGYGDVLRPSICW